MIGDMVMLPQGSFSNCLDDLVDCTLLFKFDFSFCRVHVYIDLLNGQLEKEKRDRERMRRV